MPLDFSHAVAIIKASFRKERGGWWPHHARPARRPRMRPYMTGSVTSGARPMNGGLHYEQLSSYCFWREPDGRFWWFWPQLLPWLWQRGPHAVAAVWPMDTVTPFAVAWRMNASAPARSGAMVIMRTASTWPSAMVSSLSILGSVKYSLSCAPKISLVETKHSYLWQIKCYLIETKQNISFYLFNGDTLPVNLYPIRENQSLDECYYLL